MRFRALAWRVSRPRGGCITRGAPPMAGASPVRARPSRRPSATSPASRRSASAPSPPSGSSIRARTRRKAAPSGPSYRLRLAEPFAEAARGNPWRPLVFLVSESRRLGFTAVPVLRARSSAGHGDRTQRPDTVAPAGTRPPALGQAEGSVGRRERPVVTAALHPKRRRANRRGHRGHRGHRGRRGLFKPLSSGALNALSQARYLTF